MRAAGALLAGVAAAISPVRAEQPVHLVRVWQSEDGLPGNVVRSVVQAEDGYLWVATAEGIARFDGFDFKVIEPEVGLQRSRSAFWRLFATRSGGIWAATFQGGLYRVADGRLVRVIADAETPRPPRVTQLVEAPDGRIFLKRGTEFRTVSGAEAVRTETPEADVLTLFDGDLERASRQGLSVDGGAPNLIDRHGDRWAPDAAGRLAETRAGSEPEIVDLPRGGPVRSVNELLEDREGNVWAATALHGLVRMRRAKVTVLGTDDGLWDAAVFALLEDRDGVWWLANRSGGIGRWTPEGSALLDLSGPDYRPGAALFEDRDLRLWVAARDGTVFRLEEGGFEPQFAGTQVPSKVRAMAQDPAGTIWFGGSQGIASFDGTDVLTHELGQGGGGYEVSVITVDPGGKLLLGTTSGRVLSGGRGGFSEITAEGSLDHRWVSGILAVSPAEIWVSTLGGGLFLWDGKSWHGFGPDSGLPDPRLTTMLRDDAGQLWFGSLGGIIRADRIELLAHAKDPRSPVRWLRLDRSDGLPSRECIGTGQPAGWKGSDGRLWFPTGNGIVRVQPDALELNRVPPPVYLESVRTNGLPAAPGTAGVSAGPGRARLEFRFIGISLAAPEKVTYRARLAGLDSAWRELGNQRVAAYEAVPPGEYVFEVMAISGDGQPSLSPARIAVSIHPHFWETRWFIAMGGAGVVLVAAGSGWLSARRRMKRRIQDLKIRNARESERSRIARDLHDDLGASLTEMSILAALAAEEAGDSEFQPSLNQLSAKAKNVVGTLDEIVWAVNPREDTLRSLVDYLAAFAREFLDLAGIALRNDVARDIPDFPLAAGQRHSVFLAAREALNNVVKHSHASEVRLVVTLVDRTLEIRISDNGRGFDETNQSTGHGLENLRRRMRDAGGDCRIESSPARGTSVIFRLPVRQPKA